MYIAVTGFCGTGSSAVIDLLKEFEGFDLALGDNYEHNFLFVPNGLFDLEDKLLKNNDPFRSDEAIRSFMKAMDNLYYNDYGWFGSYRRLLGNQFKEAVSEFIDSISYQGNEEWYGRYEKTKNSLSIWLVQSVIQILKGKEWGRKGKRDIIDRESPTYHSYIDEGNFYIEAKKLVEKYLNMCNVEQAENILFDHLVWLQNCDRIPQYFGEDFKVIVVKRDPRDVFFSEKYLWKKYYKTKVLPEDAAKFTKYYKWLFKDIDKEFSNVLIMNFEDLVYDYDNTVEHIIRFLGVKNIKHIKKKQFFNPNKSIENTQIFMADFIDNKEKKLIEKELENLLYEFPYEKEWNSAKSFV